MNYKVVCTTDPYHASREVGFKLNDARTSAHKVIESGLSLRGANGMLRGLMQTRAERWFANWGLACIWANRNWMGAGSNDGLRWFRYDVWTYSVEEDV